MRALRGAAWGVMAVSIIAGAVFAVTNPSMTHMELLYAYWPNFLLFCVAFGVLACTERRGAL